MGKFKGEINLNGRPKGSKNVATKEVREAFKMLVQDNLSQLQEDINHLEPKERLEVIIKMANLVLPKLKQVELNDITLQSVEFKQPIIIEAV